MLGRPETQKHHETTAEVNVTHELHIFTKKYNDLTVIL